MALLYIFPKLTGFVFFAELTLAEVVPDCKAAILKEGSVLLGEA